MKPNLDSIVAIADYFQVGTDYLLGMILANSHCENRKVVIYPLTPGLAAYLPVLLVSGILTGTFTGLCAQFLLARLDKIGQNGGPAG